LLISGPLRFQVLPRRPSRSAATLPSPNRGWASAKPSPAARRTSVGSGRVHAIRLGSYRTATRGARVRLGSADTTLPPAPPEPPPATRRPAADALQYPTR